MCEGKDKKERRREGGEEGIYILEEASNYYLGN